MSKKAAPLRINLVPKDPFFETPLGKVLRWALSVGRYIVIFTELVVITSFGSRFYLDRQLTNLNTALLQKETQITSYGDLEQKVRLAQQKIDQYQQIEQQGNLSDIFPKLSAITPRDVRLDQLLINPTSVSLEGTTLSQSSLNLLISNLQLSKEFLNVTVDRIEANTNDDSEAGFMFRIRFDTKQVQTIKNQTGTTENGSILDRTQGL
ncbi:MAG TPA: PilN domain-containing protein [Vitreimonas sp.]|nr:PilN domain-containing protein [Vitreimonas sp.]